MKRKERLIMKKHTKLYGFILSMALILSTAIGVSAASSTPVSVGSSELSPDSVIGDVTGDGNITLADSIGIQKYVLTNNGLSDAQRFLADVDDNGEVALSDAILAQKHTIGISVKGYTGCSVSEDENREYKVVTPAVEEPIYETHTVYVCQCGRIFFDLDSEFDAHILDVFDNYGTFHSYSVEDREVQVGTRVVSPEVGQWEIK